MNRKSVVLTLSAVAVFAAGPKPSRDAGISLVRVPHGGIQPQAALDPAGALHLLYFAGDPQHGDLFYVKSSNYGATWSAPLRVNSTPHTAIAMGTIRGGQMSLGSNDRVHVAWNGSPESQSKGPLNPENGQRGVPMFYSRLADDHTAFEPERNLMTHTFGLDGGGTLAADAAGQVYVAWHGKSAGAAAGEAGRQVWVTVSHDEGRTFAAEVPAWNQPTGACGCCGMAMMADSQGTVRILYRSATANVHRDIYLLTLLDHGPGFGGRKLHTWDINACPMSSMAFSESAGTIVGAWETSGQVYFENLTGAKPAPVSAPGEGKGRKHPRVAIGPDGEMLMAWTEGTGWQRGGSLAWRLFDGAGHTTGEMHTQAGVPAWSFGAAVAKPNGFLILY